MAQVSADTLWEDIEKIRSEAPLVHNITNYVVMNTTANALLAIGASPVMAHAVEEVEEMVGLAGALVINIGTLSSAWIDSMLKAAAAAGVRGIPYILDPVGAGATAFRTETSLRIIETAVPAVLRGNPSEIRAIHYAEAATKGVDSRHSTEAALEAAQKLSETLGTTVSVSGETDLIIEGQNIVSIANGHPVMPRVTGLGCTASALTGAFAAVNSSSFSAAAHAMAAMGIAGEMAAEKSSGPGSFQMNFLDALYMLDADEIRRRLKVNMII
jgi:hydroxyethylthiazole kinase